MTTARERMLQLSSLSTGNTARLHFLSITQGSGDIQIFDVMEVELDMCDYDVKLQEDFCVQLQEDEYKIELEDNDYEVEFC